MAVPECAVLDGGKYRMSDETLDRSAAEPPSVVPAATPSRLEALVFTDIVDSTGLKARLGTVAYTERLQRHNALFHEAVGTCPDAVSCRRSCFSRNCCSCSRPS